MSYYNNNFNPTDNSPSDNEWNRRVWNDGFNDEPVSDNLDLTSVAYDTIDMTQHSAFDLSKINFEENVLSQSFLFMMVALVITAFTSYYVSSSPKLLVSLVLNPGVFYGLMFAEIIIVMINNVTVRKNMLIPSALLFTAYSVINGITLSIIFIVYTSSSIVTTFFVAAAMFGGMAVYGLVTKRNLSSIGNILLMALWGIIIASLVNIFIKSSAMEMALNYICVLIFVGLTAYDTQKIKTMSFYTDSDNVTCVALMGAIELYLDFINIFIRLLSIMGKRRK